MENKTSTNHENGNDANRLLADSAVQDALSTIIKVSASLVTNNISSFIEDWQLPKTTTQKVKRKIVRECEKWNDIDRKRAIQLKDAYDVLSRHFR